MEDNAGSGLVQQAQLLGIYPVRIQSMRYVMYRLCHSSKVLEYSLMMDKGYWVNASRYSLKPIAWDAFLGVRDSYQMLRIACNSVMET